MNYVYRNTTVEYLFKENTCSFSGYNDYTLPADWEKYERFIFLLTLPNWYEETKLVSWIGDYKNILINFCNMVSGKPIYVCKLENYQCPVWNRGHILDKALNKFNTDLFNLSPNVNILDLKKFKQDWVPDLRYYYMYQALIPPHYGAEFQCWFEQICTREIMPAKKCLVLDLDNTLWGGVLSEDGSANLQISGSYPGNVYQDFQRLVLAVKQAGIVLCIASKNDPETVKKCFEQRSDLLVRWDDFILHKISWQAKYISVQEIASELNIGLDSVVFVDDSSLEREEMKYYCPEVIIPDFPKEIYSRPTYFAKLFEQYFSQNMQFSDVNKTDLYMKKIRADQERDKFSSLADYLKNLNIKLHYEELAENNMERISELINKSNQFNLTTHRYTKEKLGEMAKTHWISCVDVADKFGNLGICGVSIVKYQANTAEIDTFLLSCRVLGRDIEFSYMKYIEDTLKKKNIKRIKSCYVPTSKNMKVEFFYEKCGFTLDSVNSGCKIYIKEL